MSEVIRPTETIRAENLYTDQDMSVALVALNGINRSTINYGSTTTYEVITGRGIMFVDRMMHAIEPGAKITVPQGTAYYDAGKDVVMWATSTPPFNMDSVVEVDKN